MEKISWRRVIDRWLSRRITDTVQVIPLICPFQADSWLPDVRSNVSSGITPRRYAYLRNPGMAQRLLKWR